MSAARRSARSSSERHSGIGDTADSRIEDFIRANLALGPVPFVPEIRLYKAVPSSGLRRLAETDEAFGNPYWAYYWGGGLALARYILDNPHVVAGKRVLDVGTGSGVVAIATALAGASRTSAVDIDPYALMAAGMNSRENGVALDLRMEDIAEAAPPDIDVVTVADLFYDAATAAGVKAFMGSCAASGISVLAGDPWRAHLPVKHLDELARYSICEKTGGFRANAKPSGVFSFRR